MGNKEGSAAGSNIPGGSLIPLLPAGPRALRTVFVLSLLLLFYILWSVWLATSGSPTIDFFTFWTVPQTLSHQPVGNIYSEEGQRKLALSAAEQAGSPHAPDLQKRTASIEIFEDENYFQHECVDLKLVSPERHQTLTTKQII